MTLPSRPLLALAATALLCACSGTDRDERRETGTGIPPMPQVTQAAGPAAKALAALSITGGGGAQGDPHEQAMRCAVALRTLTSQLQDYPALLGEAQKAALRKAQSAYDQRVAAAAARQGISAQESRSTMEQQVQLGLDDPAPQVQRVTGCLRRLAGPGRLRPFA